MHIRMQIYASDRTAIKKIIESTGFFSRSEQLVALELVESRLAQGLASGYYFLISEDEDGDVFAYSCYGPIPCTQNSFDLYWIAVDRDHQGLGNGKKLLYETERNIEKIGGKRIYIETSSRRQYSPTRQFYQDAGYCKEAVLKNFYSDGDDKYIYSKKLSS